MTVNDQHVLAALRATGGSITAAELDYQMRRHGRPHIGPGAVQGALARLHHAGLAHQPYATVDTWTAGLPGRTHA